MGDLIPATNDERDETRPPARAAWTQAGSGRDEKQDDDAVLRAIRGGARRAAKIQQVLGWPDEARYSRLNASLQRLRKAGHIEYWSTGWH